MAENNLIQTLAIWGAVTGTIGTATGVINLILRYRAHKRDNPFLKCEPEFSFRHQSGVAQPRHQIIVRSVGRRPVSLDYVSFFMRPRGRWHRVFRLHYWQNKRWVYDQILTKPICLTEGQKAEIYISLPEGFPLSEVLKVKVHDQAGNDWNVSWPGLKRLRRLIKNQQIDRFEEENDRQKCRLVGYLAGDSFNIYAEWNGDPWEKEIVESKTFHFRRRDMYERKWENITESQVPKLLKEEISEIA